MATQLGELVFKITGDNSDAKKKLHETDTTATKTASGVSGSMKKIGVAIIAAFAVDRIISFGKTLIAASSAAAETRQKFGVVFAGIREQADKTAQTFAESFGLSTRAAEEYLSTTGNLLQSIGMTEQASLDMSVALNSVAADLVSFTNYSGGMEGAAQAVQSALLGEREALKGLGIALSDNDLKQYAESQGLVYASLTKSQMATLTLSVIQERAGNALGDYARSGDSLANTLRAVNSKMEDAARKAGDQLAPAVTDLAKAFGDSVAPGGVFSGVLDNIASAASAAVSKVASLLASLNQISLTDSIKEDREALKSLNSALDVTKERIENDYGSIEKLKAAAKNDSTARAILNTYVSQTSQIKALNTEIEKLSKQEQSDKRKQAQKDINTLYKQAEDLITSYAAGQRSLGGVFKEMSVTEIMSRADARPIMLQYNGLIAEAERLAAKYNVTLDEVGSRPLKVPPKNPPAGGGAGKPEKDPKIELDEMTRQILALESAMGILSAGAAVLWDTLTPEEKVLAGISAVSSALSGLNDMMGNVGNLAAAVYASMGADLEEQRDAELEAKGVKEDTAVETAQKEYDLAMKGSNNDEKIEKKKALDRAVINEKYNKKKAKLEYEAAMVGWDIQMAQAVATSAMAILNAGMAGFKYGPVTASLFAGYATVFSGLQVAAINYSKPRPPKYETGGIVPGSSFSGDENMARVNSGEMIINTKDQNSLWDFIKGGASAGSTIHLTVNLGSEKFFETITQAVRDREIIIDSGAVV